MGVWRATLARIGRFVFLYFREFAWTDFYETLEFYLSHKFIVVFQFKQKVLKIASLCEIH